MLHGLGCKKRNACQISIFFYQVFELPNFPNPFLAENAVAATILSEWSFSFVQSALTKLNWPSCELDWFGRRTRLESACPASLSLRIIYSWNNSRSLMVHKFKQLKNNIDTISPTSETLLGTVVESNNQFISTEFEKIGAGSISRNTDRSEGEKSGFRYDWGWGWRER